MKTYILSINPRTHQPDELYIETDGLWYHVSWDGYRVYVLPLSGEAEQNARAYARYQEEKRYEKNFFLLDCDE